MQRRGPTRGAAPATGCSTALFYYRPTPPPPVDGVSVARFLRAFAAIGACAADGPFAYEIKAGSRIDRDDAPASWVRWVDERMGVRETLRWDEAGRVDTLEAMAERLAAWGEPLYRARLALGAPPPDLGARLDPLGPRPERPLELAGWHLEFGPVESCGLESDGAYYVGWIRLGLFGPGCLWPAPLEAWVRRAEAEPTLRRVTEACRAAWPVETRPPNRRLRRLRGWMGNLWPYAEERPVDWAWGLAETGTPRPEDEARLERAIEAMHEEKRCGSE
jgi:hypothetical protein